MLKEVLCECSAGALHCCFGERASELTLVSELSSQSFWFAGKPVPAFISKPGKKRIGGESLDPAGIIRAFRSLRDENPLRFCLLRTFEAHRSSRPRNVAIKFLYGHRTTAAFTSLQPLHAFFREALAPMAYRLHAGLHLPGHLRILFTLG
jgi:hypothetical protein